MHGYLGLGIMSHEQKHQVWSVNNYDADTWTCIVLSAILQPSPRFGFSCLIRGWHQVIHIGPDVDPTDL